MMRQALMATSAVPFLDWHPPANGTATYSGSARTFTVTGALPQGTTLTERGEWSRWRGVRIMSTPGQPRLEMP